MNLTPAAANLLIDAFGRADCEDRISFLSDMRTALGSFDPKGLSAFDDLISKLRKFAK